MFFPVTLARPHVPDKMYLDTVSEYAIMIMLTRCQETKIG